MSSLFSCLFHISQRLLWLVLIIKTNYVQLVLSLIKKHKGVALSSTALCYISIQLWNVPPQLVQPCYVAPGRALIWGLFIAMCENEAIWIQLRFPLPGFELRTAHSKWFWTNALDHLAMVPAFVHPLFRIDS